MPTYDYACRSCGHVWEASQRITEEPLRECPECKQETAQRQISTGGGFILKGGGWYADLYSKPAGKSDGKAEGAKSETKTEKTETKAETKSEPSTSSSTSNKPAAA